jgi:hypothetical protein
MALARGGKKEPGRGYAGRALAKVDRRYGTVIWNASTVDPSTPAELRTVITALPGAVVLPPKTPVIVCAYVPPAAAPVTGPIVLKAPPDANRKYHSTSQMSGTLVVASAGRLPTADPLEKNLPTEVVEVVHELMATQLTRRRTFLTDKPTRPPQRIPLE